MELKFNLKDKEKAFLKEFYEKQHDGAKDNLGTRDAIHVVERICKEFVSSEDGYWVVPYSDEEYDRFEDLIEALNHEEDKYPNFDDVCDTTYNGIYIESDIDYVRAFGIEAYKGKYVTYTSPVAFFFILDEAKRYKNDYQAHNCSDCRIYTYGLGYSNYGDLPVFRNMLLNMGKELIENEEGAKNENKEDS